MNFDEDLHFSTYYLRASGAAVTAPLYPGYSLIVASYEDFNETYYLRKDECQKSALAIRERALREPLFLPRILTSIHKHSDVLADIFPSHTSAELLAGLSTARIVALYRRHDAANRRLYRVARLPEALDRGDSHFTQYLHHHLLSLGVREGECREIFSILARPTVPSVLAQEISEFDEIVKLARTQTPAVKESGRARMLLHPDLYERLNVHRQRWQYLSYHGYGRRQLSSLDDYIGRLFEALRNPQQLADCQAAFAYGEPAAKERQSILRSLKIDARHAALFAVYPEIGAAKLYRRYAQLRNFYFLDLLLADIARRLRVSEWTVRCMLPEEIVDSLHAGKLIRPAIAQRLQREGCVYVMLDGKEHIATGQDATALRELLRPPKTATATSNILRGTVASRGKATGRCRVIIRADDCRGEFAKGTILVSESTDPDLVRFLRAAGAVLTEQGGVTSHAAIICRELGIPTIIGIDDLLSRVHNGDWLDVDAEQGVVTLRKTEPHVSPSVYEDPRAIGAKAHNLGRVRALGFAVPKFVVVDYDKVRRAARQASGALSRTLVAEVLAELALAAGDRLSIRSSATTEDRADGSAAGAYSSLLDIEQANLSIALRDFVARNRRPRNGQPYQGAVIVQRMIDADWAGVCLTRDSRTGNQDAVIIEMAAGGNVEVTGGTGRPDRVIIDRLTGDILDERRSASTIKRSFDLSAMVRQFLTLESRFGKPLDIEWAVTGQELFILQARPIVSLALTQRSLVQGADERI